MVEVSYVKYVYKSKMENLISSIGLIEASLSNIEEQTYQFITSGRVQTSVSNWLEAEECLDALTSKKETIGEEGITEKEYQRIKTVSVLNILKELDSSLAKNSDIITGFYLAPDGKRYYGHGGAGTTISKEKELEILKMAKERMGDLFYIVSTERPKTDIQNMEENRNSQIILARAIKEKKDLSMRYSGTLFYIVDLERLTSSYTSENHKLMIQDHYGSTIFSTLSDEEQSDFRNYKAGHRKAGYEIMALDNTKYFLTDTMSGERNWKYYSFSPYQQLFRILADADRLFILVFILLFLPIVAVTIRISLNLIKPICSLSEKIREIRGNNELANNLRGAGGEENLPRIRTDEIGELQEQFYNMIQEVDELIHENYEQKIYLQEAQLSALQAQLNPHFLYNTLDTIRWMATANDYQQIPGVVKALGDILRLCMNSDRNIISVGEEIDYLRSYVAIQKIRFGDRLYFLMDVEEELMELGIPAFSIQPLVENSINYALERMMDQCYITVTVTDCGDNLAVMVQDNGPGMDSDIMKKLRKGVVKARGNGIGLLNLDKRLRNLYGSDAGIRIERPEEGGARIMYCVRKERYIRPCED